MDPTLLKQMKKFRMNMEVYILRAAVFYAVLLAVFGGYYIHQTQAAFQSLAVTLRLSAADASNDVCADTHPGDGYRICDILPGQTYKVGGSWGDSDNAGGTLFYGPGFPSGLPAMGMGRPGIGYIPLNYPFTCTASLAEAQSLTPLAIGTGNSDGWKICEISFNNSNITDAVGKANYYITAGATASDNPNDPDGLWLFGLHSNYGSSFKLWLKSLGT